MSTEADPNNLTPEQQAALLAQQQQMHSPPVPLTNTPVPPATGGYDPNTSWDSLVARAQQGVSATGINGNSDPYGYAALAAKYGIPANVVQMLNSGGDVYGMHFQGSAYPGSLEQRVQQWASNPNSKQNWLAANLAAQQHSADVIAQRADNQATRSLNPSSNIVQPIRVPTPVAPVARNVAPVASPQSQAPSPTLAAPSPTLTPRQSEPFRPTLGAAPSFRGPFDNGSPAQPTAPTNNVGQGRAWWRNDWRSRNASPTPTPSPTLGSVGSWTSRDPGLSNPASSEPTRHILPIIPRRSL